MDRYAVVGNPVSHSLSPRIHALFAHAMGEALEYSTLEAPLDRFASAMRAFFASGARGANVTLPFKVEALAFAHSASERAKIAGAANFLAARDGRIEADNTDGAGLVADLERNARFAIQGRRILMLGAGGAARGVMAPLLAKAPALLVVANRTPGRARELVERFHPLGPVRAADLTAIPREGFDLVLNATSTSVRGEALALSVEALSREALAYDMAYGKSAQASVAAARASGFQACDGLGMLVEQAAESFELWRGRRPATAPVLEELRPLRA
ncbi:MAG TPA: shikimate dehydrogenase [Usitatibacter sp.]|nr:shikimate dehydrogenase [Usitatibacter sp.]